MLDAVRRCLPEVLVMENIPELANGEPGTTDMDTIGKELTAMDYWFWWHVFDAADYGSCATRSRVYGLAVHRRADASGELRHLAHTMMAATHMGMTPFTIDQFVVMDDLQRRAYMMIPAFSDSPDKQAREVQKEDKKEDMKFRDEHNEFFRMMSFTWPPKGFRAKPMPMSSGVGLQYNLNLCAVSPAMGFFPY